MSGEFESLRVDEINVGGRNGEDDAVRFCDVFRDEVSGLLFNVGRLVANRNLRLPVSRVCGVLGKTSNLCQTRQVDQSQAQDMGRVNFEIDWLSVDALVATCDPGSLCFNLPLDLGEIVPSPAGYMMKFGPLLLSCDTGRGVRDVYFVVRRFVLPFARHIDELENQRSPCDDTASSRQEISADDVLKDGRLSRRLRSNDNLSLLLASKFSMFVWAVYTICGRSRESLPIVLKTRSWSLLTI